MSDPICGGHSAPSDSEVPEDLTEIVKTLEGEIGSATGSTGPFEIKSFTQQVVAGMIYHVKLAAAEEAYVHARIFKPLPHTGAAATLQVAKSGFGKDDELAVMNPE